MLEELFVAVAGQVIAEALIASSDRVREWLKRDPATLAYQKALARTYTAFTRQYPELTSSLFDKTFLKDRAASELAKMLTRDGQADAGVLRNLWLNSLSGGGAAVSYEKREIHFQAASEFVRLMEAELKAELYFQPLFDSRALEALPQIEAKLDELPRRLAEALTAAQKYETLVRHGGVDVTGSAHVGRDMIGGNYNVTQTFNLFLSDNAATLKELYIPPDAVFQRVGDEFVGREWLAAKVDAFLDDENQTSGVFMLEGVAGVGKTAFMAHLVRQHRYLHLFAEQVPGEANVSRALQSLGAQIVSKYLLDEYEQRDTLPAISVFPDFLDRLVRHAANQLTAGERIVIVCDALDEAGVGANGNVFGLPSVLPEGVYLILSQRPVPTQTNFKSALHIEKLEATSDENLDDVETYLTHVAHRPIVAQQLYGMYSEHEFITTLRERSGGVWMYLQYVIQEIQGGSRHPLDLAQLPPGLAGYYAEYWGDWSEGRRGRGEGRHKWDALYMPLLTTLAAAQEPLTLEQLTEWANVKPHLAEARRVLAQYWKAFLTVGEPPGQARHYGIYHASLRDFVTGRVSRDNLLPNTRYLVEELADGVIEAHTHIVEFYRQRCQGHWVQLIENDYVRRNIVLHLIGAREFDDVFKLVAQSNVWAEARYTQEGDYAGYLTDLAQAWRRVESSEGWDIGKQIRCALIQSSIYSLAGNIQPELIELLVKTGIWSPARALVHLEQIPNEEQRARTLVIVGPQLGLTLWHQALSIARGIQNENYRAIALMGVLACLPPELKQEVVKEVLAVKEVLEYDYYLENALMEVAANLPADLQREAVATSVAIRHKAHRVEMQRELKAQRPSIRRKSYFPSMERKLYLPFGQQQEVVKEALATARAIHDEDAIMVSLIEVAAHLPAELQSQTFAAVRAIQDATASTLSGGASKAPSKLESEVLARIRAIQNEHYHVDNLSDVAAQSWNELKEKGLAEGLTEPVIRYEFRHAPALRRRVVSLPPDMKQHFANEALDSIRAIQNENYRAAALIGVSSHLSLDLQGEALAMAWAIQDNYYRAVALSGVAVYLSPELQGEAVKEALIAARALQYEYYLAISLRRVAPQLPPPLRGQALKESLAAAREIRHNAARAEALTGVALHLPPEIQSEVMKEAMAVALAIEDEIDRAVSLSGLVPYLLPDMQMEVLAAARTIKNGFASAVLLSDVASQIDRAARGQVLSEAFALAVKSESVASYPRRRADLLHWIVDQWQTWKLEDFEKEEQQLAHVFRTLGKHVRRELLADLSALAPLIHHFGGANSMAETLYAIQDVTNWWR